MNPIRTCPHLHRLWRLSKSLSPHLSSMEDQKNELTTTVRAEVGLSRLVTVTQFLHCQQTIFVRLSASDDVSSYSLFNERVTLLQQTVMKGITVVVILAIGIARAQLNFEGNPLTEYTEYTAEESQFSSKATKKDNDAVYLAKQSPSNPQKLYPVHVQNKDTTANGLKSDGDGVIQENSKSDVDFAARSAATGVTSARELVDNTYRQVQQPQVLQPVTNTVKTSAEIALSTFLNSKTPEESRMSLDYFLQNSPPQNSNQVSKPNVVASQNQQQQQIQAVPQHGLQMQQSLRTSQQTVEQLPSHSQINQRQQQQVVAAAPLQKQVFSQPQQILQMAGQPYDYAVQHAPNPQVLQPSQSVQLGPVIPNQPVLQQQPFPPDSFEAIHSRSDMVAPVMWRQRNRWVRGKPYPLVQPKIGGVFPKAPFPRKGPVELIYTKPPGYYRGPSHGPMYEDASAWFPDANSPPPATNDIYYSQLYAQSYDPHYYNYIAKTGKIKPHLYGKLGKYPEHEDGGIWAELYRGFTKHGLKNMMTPGFLLGMTLPMITVMLMALVQKRSFGRSDSRNLQEEDSLQEYLERLQRALECYEKKRRKTGDVTTDDC
ncbi:hypothetical protein KPH14_001199 [Odynerus spinipes]|uniref:Uncharacterized protein n=1 Tax=Odynerus spinipes TaxID=1348599 RepID=A0AAD9VR48_9HYME|nr:hypothetical protein KPH14_001199 [Odynerus spinipes]